MSMDRMSYRWSLQVAAEICNPLPLPSISLDFFVVDS